MHIPVGSTRIGKDMDFEMGTTVLPYVSKMQKKLNYLKSHTAVTASGLFNSFVYQIFVCEETQLTTM